MLSVRVTQAAGKLPRGHFHKDRILSDTLDIIPRNYKVILLPDSEKPTASPNHQSKNPCVLAIKFKIGGIPKPCPVTKIYDFQSPQIGCTEASHRSYTPSIKRYLPSVYAEAWAFLAVHPKLLRNRLTNSGSRFLRSPHRS